MDLSLARRFARPFEAVRSDIIAALAKEGFGILSTIDLEAKFEEKLGKSAGAHVILGACNPALAWRATQAVPELAVLLPCNVVLRQTDDGVVVDIMDPEAALGLLDDATVAEVAMEAKERLVRVLADVAS